ncbi:MAG: hypothetical protein P0Y66_06035 [Candidatus Kaistia colombiensis]|nr:MAG: hypothetical protein P0Y66_06035 [Kaistia sp.]
MSAGVDVVDKGASIALLHVVVMEEGIELTGIDRLFVERDNRDEDRLLVGLALEMGLYLLGDDHWPAPLGSGPP